MLQAVDKKRVEGFTRALLVSQKICSQYLTGESQKLYSLLGEILDGNEVLFHWDQVIKMSYNYHRYDDNIEDHRVGLLINSLLGKFENILNNESVKNSAMVAFDEAEYHCYLANQAAISGRMDSLLWERCTTDFDHIKQQVSKILGRAPSLQSVVDNGGWGPGATVTSPRRECSPELKSGFERGVTLRAAQFLCSRDIDISCTPWLGKPLVLVPGNLVVTVPKNSKTDRTIAIEPGINSWCQKGIAYTIRRRLKRFGIDLNDQSHNAYFASCADTLGVSTLDLKAASDTLPLFVIERLIPKDWWELLQAFRCDRYSLTSRGDEYSPRDYHKLSSMGNGFTFEIETVIFLACALAVGSRACLVYGDDIVIEKSLYHPLISLLECLGFTVNYEKSFHDGYFYESCGMFSYRGCDITPFRIKEGLYGPKDLIVLANKIRYFSHLSNHFIGCDRRLLPAWRDCVNWLPNNIRLKARGPLFSALTLFCNLNEVATAYSPSSGGFVFHAISVNTSTREADFDMLLWHRLRQLNEKKEQSIYDESQIECGNIVKREPKFRRSFNERTKKWDTMPDVSCKLTRRLSIERWYNFGPWQ